MQVRLVAGLQRSVLRRDVVDYAVHEFERQLRTALLNLTTSLDQMRQRRDGIWLVSFMDYDLGYIDLEEKTLQPLQNPFAAKVSPVS